MTGCRSTPFRTLNASRKGVSEGMSRDSARGVRIQAGERFGEDVEAELPTDLDGDGRIDGIDLALLGGQFGGTTAARNAAAGVEP